MKLLLATLRLVVAFGLGAFMSFQVTQWRVGAAQGREALYAVGASQMLQELQRCELQPRRGTFVK